MKSVLFIYFFSGVSVCVNADRTGQLSPPPFSQMSRIWKITMCEKNIKRRSGFLLFFRGRGVSVCVNADRTVQLAPLFFFTNESHLKNYYV